MLESFMGVTDFKHGVTAYLKGHQFGNAKTDDLWTYLTKVSFQQTFLAMFIKIYLFLICDFFYQATSNNDIKKIMHSWTTQSNYPLVTVKSRKDENGKTVLELKQDVFLLNPESSKNIREMAALLWNIPIFYKTMGKSN
jgi:aminopeptidase N